MGIGEDWSRDAVLCAVAYAAREMMRDGYVITADLREALDRMDWREWSEGWGEHSEGPSDD